MFGPASAQLPYERLLGDPLRGDGGLFVSDECAEAARAVVDDALAHERPVLRYAPGTWGPAEADAIAQAEGWHDPRDEEGDPC
jgi:glucose-6-phosphate 1-dehydrogenase